MDGAPLLLVNSRVRLSFCRDPTKPWWQTFVGAGGASITLSRCTAQAATAQKTVICAGTNQGRARRRALARASGTGQSGRLNPPDSWPKVRAYPHQIKTNRSENLGRLQCSDVLHPCPPSP